jgi:hypothetical protein
LIFGVADKKVITESKKIWMRHAVVFQDHRSFNMLKDPVKPTTHPKLAAHILFCVMTVYLARPIDFLYNGARFSAPFNISWMTGPWSIGNDE